jgi:hypothetical protein
MGKSINKNTRTESGVTPTKMKFRRAITWVMVFLLAISGMYMAPDTANAEIEMKDGVFRYSTTVTMAAGSIRYMSKRQTFPTFNAPQHPCENEGNPLKQEVAS